MSVKEEDELRIDSILDFIKSEKIRILKKGPQAFIGYGLVIFYFFGVPNIVYPLYSSLWSHDLITVLIIGVPLSVSISLIIFNLIMNNIYLSKYPYFEQYKIMQKPWPWEADEKGYSKQYKEIIINTMIGNVVIFPIFLYLINLSNLVDFISDPKLYPSSYEIFKQIVLMTIIFETLFYWIHRFFHISWFYKKFHKQHHEYQVTVSIASLYNQPIDTALTNIIPSLIAEIILGRIHVITVHLWHLYTSIFVILLHSGYNLPWFPWSVFPFGPNIDYHDYHHSPNIGNYGVFSTFWDTICGTNKHYRKYIAKGIEKNH